MADVWSNLGDQLGKLLVARKEADGGTLLTPAERDRLDAQGIVTPRVALDANKEAYYYFDDKQIEGIISGRYVGTTNANAEIGKRDQPVQSVKVVSPDTTNGGDTSIVMPQITLPVGLQSPVPTTPAANEPHPFAGTNVEEMLGYGVALIVIMMFSKVVGSLLSRGK